VLCDGFTGRTIISAATGLFHRLNPPRPWPMAPEVVEVTDVAWAGIIYAFVHV
jgi:hypothetical protein